MQTKAKLRHLRVAPRKVRLLIDIIRGKKVEDALAQLKYSQKNAAKNLEKLLKSAIANADHNHKMKSETLIVKEAYVDGGPILYRWMPRAFGRASKIRKRTSHITLVLEGEAEDKDNVTKVAVKKENKKPKKKTKNKKNEK
ncbi:MAG: 50S ribosomal protein L22 [Candidatus Magasanikbacteria bacterium CG_4_10_14_0_2_um_filter_37_12]|uniref:Large ribosomal subunit protein uL22 n=1 Tax=Candidatus Magasanikbacteria bacterium CG_4_10_14_0_2_um_filter_37_12 TaxID=1974637 RepID=A0A2M7V8N0_9BACT|nr:MAG: 50S ribosomal protein L22 [Candidatus Magasanikbacteria bacterium CG_4_10_14_0_2_um_filter_37_12]